MNIAGSSQPVAGNWPLYFLKGNRRRKHFSLMQRQSHFLRQWKKQQRHYVTPLFSVFVLLSCGVIWQHKLSDSIWAKQNSGKWNANILRCIRLVSLWMLHWVTKHLSGICNSAQILSPNLFHRCHWNFQRSKYVFLLYAFSFSLLRILTCNRDTLQGCKSIKMSWVKKYYVTPF